MNAFTGSSAIVNGMISDMAREAVTPGSAPPKIPHITPAVTHTILMGENVENISPQSCMVVNDDSSSHFIKSKSRWADPPGPGP